MSGVCQLDSPYELLELQDSKDFVVIHSIVGDTFDKRFITRFESITF